MDRGRKRKADNDDVPNSASKRQKFQPETPESTTQAGLQLVDALKNAKDKTGRSIATLFLTLPDRREIPEYYTLIKLPIAIDIVEKKLKRHEYDNLAQVESDCKRMITNAKLFNDDKSEVFQDAERMRKQLSLWMKGNNPAYQDENYTSIPTPIPGEDGTNGASATPARDTPNRPKKPTINLSRGRKQSQPPAPAPETPAAAPEMRSSAKSSDVAGKSFGEAQEQLVQDLIDYVDAEIYIFEPFRNLPSRSLTDYYQLIKHPVSLSGLKKRVQGKHGRDAATGITDFKSWDAFENEASYIWKNCREYNEDGSDMYNLAAEFEEHFKTRLAAAKALVDEPAGPRLKLNARPKPKLHLGAKSSPAVSTPAVSVDNDALSRQKQLVAAGVNGHQTPQPPKSSPRATSQAPVTKETKPSPPVVKTEIVAQSPALAVARLASAAPEVRQVSQPPTTMAMPPPARIPSASPHPSAQLAVQPITNNVPVYIPAPATFIDNFSRTKPISEALLPNLQIATHPQLHAPKPFRLDITPSPDFTHQSTTLMLPAANYYLQITPTVATALSSGRQYKLFVTVNGVRVNSSIKTLFNGENALAAGMGAIGERKQVYDAPLNSGVNRIEVEIAAVAARGGGLEAEKISVFVNLMRN